MKWLITLIALSLVASGNGSHAQNPINNPTSKTACERSIQQTLNSGEVVLLPKTPCTITQPLILPALAIIRGQGKAKTIIRCKVPIGQPCLTTRRSGFDGYTPRVELHDFSIRGNGEKRIGIELLRARRPIIENVWIHDIGGTGLLIDGAAKSERKAKGHFAEVRNLHVSGLNEVGVRIRGVSRGDIMANRHRFYSLLVGGSSVVGLDVGPWVDTANFYGTAIQGVRDGIWVRCRYCGFYGVTIEGVKNNAITTFSSVATGNEFIGVVRILGMRGAAGKAWVTIP